jgi:3',5'-cyclic AMP phosphodiesterase CpdA
MIGNHDNRTKFRAAFPEADFTDCGYVQTAIQRPGWRLLCLDTVDDPAATGIPHAGYLCEDRLNWLKDALEDAGDDNVVVLTHHHPYLTGFNGMDNINLKNGDALLDLLKQYPNVRHLISGHVHRTIMGSVNGLAVAILKSTCHQMPMMLGQDGSSHSVDEPGAFGILLLGNGSAILHTEDVGLNGISGNDGHS